MNVPAPITIGTRIFDYRRPYIMGILNVTPDSFFDGGRHAQPVDALKQARQMVTDGADIIDVGGESTRPGSSAVDTEEEIRRVVPVIQGIRTDSDVPISIDTTKAAVATAALDAGADMVNDISGLRFEPELAEVAASRNVPMVLMHSRHTPETMQKQVSYGDLRGEILAELEQSVARAVERGVDENRLVLDPGIGFGKTPEHNLAILGTPGFLEPLGRPVLVGPSNKSFVGAVTDAPVDQRTGGTAAAVTAAVMGGAHFIRVHDVATMRQCALVAHAMKRAFDEWGRDWTR